MALAEFFDAKEKNHGSPRWASARKFRGSGLLWFTTKVHGVSRIGINWWQSLPSSVYSSESVQCMSALTAKNLNAPFIVFAGDSRIRQLRNALIHELTGQDYDMFTNTNLTANVSDMYGSHKSHGDFYESAGAHIRFEWLPYLDDGHRNGQHAGLTQFVNRTLNSTFKPLFLVMGVGIWRIEDCSNEKKEQKDCAKDYRRWKSNWSPQILLINQSFKYKGVIF